MKMNINTALSIEQIINGGTYPWVVFPWNDRMAEVLTNKDKHLQQLKLLGHKTVDYGFNKTHFNHLVKNEYFRHPSKQHKLVVDKLLSVGA